MRMCIGKPLPCMALLIVWGAYLALAGAAQAQQTPSPSATQDEINQQLLKRVQELEEQVKQLKALVTAQPVQGAVSAPAAAAPSPAPAP